MRPNSYSNSILFLLILTGCIQHSQDPIQAPNDQPVHRVEYILSSDENMTPDLHYRRAKAFLEKGDLVKARRELSNEMMQRTVDARYSFLLGKVFYLQKNYKQARNYLRDALELGYNQPELFKILADTLLKLNYKSQALATADRLVSLDDTPENKTIKGRVLLAAGDTIQAMTLLQQSMRQDSTIKDNYMEMTLVYRKRGDQQRANKLMDSYLTFHPNDRQVLNQKAMGLMQAGNYIEARSIYTRLLKSQPKNSELIYEHGRTYFLERRYDSAMIQAKRALMLNEDKMEARIMVAKSLENERLFDEARENYNDILAIDSTITDAVEGLDRLDKRNAYLRYLQKQKQLQRDSQIPKKVPNTIND